MRDYRLALANQIHFTGSQRKDFGAIGSASSCGKLTVGVETHSAISPRENVVDVLARGHFALPVA
jgi:hypothetical protein